MALLSRLAAVLEQIWGWQRKHRIQAATLFVVVVLTLGAWGFLRAMGCGTGGACDGFDALYRTIQTFGLNFDMPTIGESPAQMNWQIQLARYLGAIGLFAAVMSLLLGSAQEWVRITWQSLMHDRRYILLGYGDINRAIAAELAKKTGGGRILITAIDRSVSPADQRAALAAKVLLIAGDASDDDLMSRIKLQHAARIFVAAGDDARNIEIATAAARTLQAEQTRPRIFTHVADMTLHSGLTEMKDLSFVRGKDFRPFNMAQEAAHAFMYKAQLIRTARDLGQKRVHLVIMGLGNLGEAVLLDTLMNSYAHDLLPPRVTAIDSDIEVVKARLRAAYPRLLDTTLGSMTSPDPNRAFEAPPEIRYHQMALDRVDFTTDPVLDDLEMGDAPPTAFVIACGKDHLNLAIGMRLELAMDQLTRKPTPIFLRQWSSEFGNQDKPEDPFSLTRLFGNVQHSVLQSSILNADPEALPRLMHLAYEAAEKSAGEKAAAMPERKARGMTGAELGLEGDLARKAMPSMPEQENIAQSNDRKARHLPFKLAGLGLAWRGASQGILPLLDLARGDKDPPSLASTAILDQIAPLTLSQARHEQAWIEHCRWCVDRAIFGWRQSPLRQNGKVLRDNQRRFHTDMIPYADLKEDTQRKDEVGLEAVLVKIAYDGLAGSAATRPKAHKAKVRRLHMPELQANPGEDIGITDLHLCFGAGFLQALSAGEAGHVAEWQRVQRFVSTWLTWPEATRLCYEIEDPADIKPLKKLVKDGESLLRPLPSKGKLPDWPVEVSVIRRYAMAALPKQP